MVKMDETIERFSNLAIKVGETIFNEIHTKENFSVSSEVLEFIEEAVNKAIKKEIQKDQENEYIEEICERIKRTKFTKKDAQYLCDCVKSNK